VAGLGLFLILLITASVATFWRYQEPAPRFPTEVGFSAISAKSVLERILPNDNPHPLGSHENGLVRDRLIEEIRRAGAEPEVQTAFVCSPLGTCGLVHNVVVLLPGENDTALLLSAHYDSAPSGPGASDDGASVAILVELLRDRVRRPRKNSLVFLWNEGEEAGLLGSLAFMREHPLAARVGAVINLEARGTAGISQLFQSTADSEWMVRAFAETARRPFATSVSDAVLRLMPNYNDLAVFDSYGVPGVAFAFAESEARYHSSADTVANLSLGSLQSQGDNAEAMVAALDGTDLDHPAEGRSVFFDVLGLGFVSWPIQRSIPMATLLLLGLLGLIRRCTRTRLLRPRGVAAALSVPVITIAGAAAVGWLATQISGGASLQSGFASAALVSLVFGWGTAASLIGSRWLKEGEQWAAWSLLLAAGGLALAFVEPGVCYLLVVPSLFALLGGAVALRSGRFVAAAALPFACTLILWLPVLYGLVVALGLSAGVLLGAAAALSLAHGGTLLRDLPNAVPVGAAAATLPILLGAASLPAFDEERPVRCELAYVVAPSGSAAWHIGMDGGVSLELPVVESPAPPWMRLPGLAVDAEPREQPAPVLEGAQLQAVEGEWVLRGLLRSRRQTSRATLVVPGEAQLKRARIGEAVVPRNLFRWTEPGESSTIEIFGDLSAGIELELVLGVENPPPLTLADRGRPPQEASDGLLTKLGPSAVLGWDGSYSVSWSSFDPKEARRSATRQSEVPRTQAPLAPSPPASPQTEPEPSAEGFWWGIASSPYQTEDPGSEPGQAQFFETDWDLFAAAGRVVEGRGEGTRSWSRFERDVEALRALGVTHYRFGVEWARIEPRPGEYNEAALERYVGMARQLRAAGIEPVLCLWHFTFPSWATDLSDGSKHGWLNREARERWPGYVETVAAALAPEITWWAPQNEPNAQAMAGYFLGIWPPGIKRDLAGVRAQTDAAAEAWLEAAEILRRSDPDAQLITVQNIISWQQAPWDFAGVVRGIGEDYNLRHLQAVAAATDWIGFNYYYRREATVFGAVEQVHPRGLHAAIEQLASLGKPLVIMENGTGADDDSHRSAFLRAHVRQVQLAREEGHDVRGYFVWSLVDNFEWALGYDSYYGLHRYDRGRDLLVPKGSADVFKELMGAM